MKLAIVYDRIYPYTIGGGEKRNWEMARGLSQQGYEVTLLCPKFWEGEDSFVKEGVTITAVCRRQKTFNAKGKRSILEPVKFAWGLMRHLQKNDYQLIECCNFPYLSALASCFISWFKRSRLIVCWFEVRGFKGWYDYQGWRGGLAGICEIMCAHVTRYHHTISDHTSGRLRDYLKVKSPIRTIFCGISESLLDYGREVTPVKPHQLIMVGRVVQHKRYDLGLEVVAALKDRYPQICLQLVGDGDYLPTIKQRIRELGIEKHVQHPVNLPEKELYHLIAESRLMLFTSQMEGFGIAPMEAMAIGIPTLVMNSPDSAFADLIKNYDPSLLANDSNELVTKTEELLRLESAHQRARQKCLEIARLHTWEQSVHHLVDYYSKINR